jgi:HAMP domain-containing protein
MKLIWKFGLVVLLLVSLTLGIHIWVLVRNEAELQLLQQRTVTLQEEAIVKEARERAGTVASFGEACRAYTQRILAPAVEKHLGGKIVFEAQSRTFVARGTFEQLRQGPGMADYSFREASLNPLNRDKNLADDEEKKLIARFAADRKLTEQSGFVEKGGQELFFVARPIVVEKSCLRCHGRPEEVPVEITGTYGRQSGFDWQVGEINGVLMVMVPTGDLKHQSALFRTESEQLVEQYRATTRNMLLIFIASAVVLIVALAVLFHLLVNRRVANAADVMRQVASNAAVSARIADNSGDEIGTMTQAFNQMADSLEAAHRQLEQRVQERTRNLEAKSQELAASNAALQAEIAERAKMEQKLRDSTGELEQFNQLMVGREQRIIELKRQINEQAKALGRPAPYDLSFADLETEGHGP